MKKIFLFLLVLFLPNYSFAEDCESKASSYEKYDCRIKEICEKKYKDNKVVFDIIKFKEVWKWASTIDTSETLLVSWRWEKYIKEAVKIYKDNMNSIYNCAIINIQINSINLVKKDLLKWNNPTVEKELAPKIDKMLNTLDIKFKNYKCKNIDKKNITPKLNILRQTTYLTCSYDYYMEYLKEYYKDAWNAMKDELDKSSIDKTTLILSINEVSNKLINLQSSINSEVNQAYKVFPLAYHAYSEFENNFPIHFLLELLKQDFISFREKLHKVINPINQVVYKISNAMKK